MVRKGIITFQSRVNTVESIGTKPLVYPVLPQIKNCFHAGIDFVGRRKIFCYGRVWFRPLPEFFFCCIPLRSFFIASCTRGTTESKKKISPK